MKNLAVAFMGALVLAGCGSVRYPTSYVLNFPPPAPRAALSNEALGPVSIREFRCPEYLCEGRIVYRPRSGRGRVLRKPSLGDESPPGDYAIRGGLSSGPIAFQERDGPRAWLGDGVCPEWQHREIGRSGRRPRRPRRLHDLGATAGYSNEICGLESHGIGNGIGGEAGHRRRGQQPVGSRSDCSRTLAEVDDG